MNQRFLLANPFGIGDVLFSTPLIRRLKENFPGCFIGYFCNARTKEILETHPFVDYIFVYEKDNLRRLARASRWKALKAAFALRNDIKRHRFDTLIDLSLAPELSLLMKWAGIRRRVGLDYRRRGRFLTDRVSLTGFDEKPIVDYYLDLLHPLGADSKRPYRMEIWTTEEDEAFADRFFREHHLNNRVIGIAPGGGQSFGPEKEDLKRWPVVSYLSLIRALREKLDAKIVIFWGPQEKALAEELSAVSPEGILLSPPTTIRQAASLIKRLHFLICTDGGLLRVAVAVGTKTLSLFGPTDETVYGPSPEGNKHRVLTQPVVCRPCYRRFKLPECAQNVCLQWISPETVFRVAQAILEEGKIGNSIGRPRGLFQERPCPPGHSDR